MPVSETIGRCPANVPISTPFLLPPPPSHKYGSDSASYGDRERGERSARDFIVFSRLGLSFVRLIPFYRSPLRRQSHLTRTVRRGYSEPASRGQQVVDISSDLRWIRIPFALPVAVYLPIWTRKLAIVGSTPLANCIVRSAQAASRYKARDALSMPRGRRAWRKGRPPPPRKRSIQLHTDFQANVPSQ